MRGYAVAFDLYGNKEKLGSIVRKHLQERR